MSNHFEYRNGQLFAEELAVSELAQRYGTPLYLYSSATLRRHYQVWTSSLGPSDMVCFAVKANSNLGILSLLAQLGSGFDIVSRGELERVLAAGGRPDRILFSGLGKSAEDMRRALEVGVHCFNVESEAELELLNQVARDMGTRAPVSVRVNPDVDAKTHPYISTGLKENKFGIDISLAPDLYRRARGMDGIRVTGIDCHIGSQLTEIAPFLDALDRVIELLDRLVAEGLEIEHLDLGGGLGVIYNDENPPLPDALCSAVKQRMGNRPQQLIFEPGRSIAANAGLLVTRVDYLKPTAHRNFAIVDASMSEMLRPALYQSWMRITEVDQRDLPEVATWDVVGAVCESSDFLGKDRQLAIRPGDLLALHSAGAYGFTMASNYNTRPRPAEVLVDGDRAFLVRERETLEDLMRGEHALQNA